MMLAETGGQPTDQVAELVVDATKRCKIPRTRLMGPVTAIYWTSVHRLSLPKPAYVRLEVSSLELNFL